MDKLDERKTRILKAIIKSYLETGEPVGSRTISKYTDLNLSPATIRNEMADLEDMGYIVQPHTSAGRIPSDQGYRFYVDNLMEEKDKEIAEMKEFVIETTGKMENTLKSVAKLLASNTNYATMITAPQFGHGKLKFIQLSQVDEEQLVAVIVLEGNIVKNKIIYLDEGQAVDNEQLLKLNLLLNTSLNGMTLNEINLAVIAKLKEQAGSFSEVVSRILDAIAESIAEDEDLEVYTSGATNIFKYPELADSQSVSEIISAFEEKEELRELAREAVSSDETGIQVYIGDETRVQNMKDCSVVTAAYDLGDGMKGTIGIIGPKRMDYENVVNNLRTLKKQLDGVFKKKE